MKYTVKMVVNRDRMYEGDVKTCTIQAQNDFHALLQVFLNYDIESKSFLTDSEEVNSLCLTIYEKDIEKLKELLTTEDISDYYDNVVWVKDEDGKFIFEDCFDDEYLADFNQIGDEEENE